MKKMIVFLCMVCAFMVSCSEEPEIVENPGSHVETWNDTTITGDAMMSQMMFSVGYVMSVERDSSTRTTTSADGTGAFSAGDLVSVAVTRSGGSEVVKTYRVKSDHSLEYVGDEDPFIWKSTGETVSIRAWSYGDNTTTSVDPESVGYTLETNQQANGYKELLYCLPSNKSYSGGNITLNFYHQLTRVVVNLTSENGLPLSVSSVRIGDGNTAVIPTTATFNKPLSGNIGTWSSIGTEKGYIQAKADVANSSYSAMLIPTTYSSGKKFISVITADSKTYTYVPNSNITLSAGNQYVFTIQVKNRPKLPIEYVAPYNMQTATKMAPDNSPENSGYFYWGTKASSTPQTILQNWKKGTGYAGYHLPTAEEWMAIIAPNLTSSNSLVGSVLDIDGSDGSRITYRNGQHLNMGETMAWGVTNNNGTYTYAVRQKFYNDYTCPDDDAHAKIGYALRFKEKSGSNYVNGQYTCAYRYEYIYSPSKDYGKLLRIKVKYIGANNSTTITTISKESYGGWTSPDFTLELPVCGHMSGADADPVYYNYPADGETKPFASREEKFIGYYWTATQLNNNNAFYASFYEAHTNVRSNLKSLSISVRLFADAE